MFTTDRRLRLHNLLKAITDNVYFEPPGTLVYPCIVYHLDDVDTKFADNIPYRFKKRYQVTVIDKESDSQIPDKVAALPTCSFNTFFVVDNLNHFVYTIYS